jgi:DNA-binding MarR family transcriptional regulator
MEKEKTFDHALRATWQAVAKYYNEKALKHESTMAMAMAILYIDYEKGTASTALGPSMGMEPTSLSRILNNMEEKGFILREKNPNDGRGVIIRLTELGKKKREISRTTVFELNNKIKENLTEEKIKNFFEVIDTINNVISKKELYFNN